MLYINPIPNDTGGLNPPQTTYAKGLFIFPDEYFNTFQEYNGFVILTIDGDTVTAVEPNIETWEAWKATQPTDEPTEPTTDTVTWDELDKAYTEGVNSAYEQ
jgi:hypothetical protein